MSPNVAASQKASVPPLPSTTSQPSGSAEQLGEPGAHRAHENLHRLLAVARAEPDSCSRRRGPATASGRTFDGSASEAAVGGQKVERGSQYRRVGSTRPRRASIGSRGSASPRRIAAIAESATLAVDAKAKALKAAGEDVIGFGAGEPDFPTPDAHRRGRRRGLPRPARTTATRRRVACPSCGGDRREDQARLGLRRAAPSQVLVTNGGKHAVYNTFATLLDPGDEVLLPAPYWTTYPESIALAGGVPVVVPTDRCRPGSG